jgi:16S rRNA (guanine527-N7)-methyltransferase
MTGHVRLDAAAPFGPNEFQAATCVSRETMARLKQFAALLADWNSRHNLVSATSLSDVWRRHIWDSAQLLELMPPAATSLVDLGSGAGFPGLILSILRKEGPPLRTVLFEARRKKCAFLAAAAQKLHIEPEIRNMRLEDAADEPFDVVTARACAPLPRLLLYAQAFQSPRTVNLFLKGQSVGGELTEAHKSWRMQVRELPSRSDPSGSVLVIEGLRHAS